ncbi:TlpA family protein disulfide reductase [Luteolibacter flavescens]|uniref:TlpA family protein disulfide reductase n=1 Tax=Luteolibacter flavescens TaxID=1859460 RepID=A0ABT3FNY2_9BACT|nr:TlpA disulfide reductase family protein [Luteolibacter flavescens]MCW1885275.1 TlpA family protein disulfide reductase [Luteolibacter flavescens]
MKAIPALIALVALALPAFAADKKNKDKASVPDASVSQVKWAEVVNGASFDKDALTGKVVVVEEWGVNCGPCIASLPDMAKLAKRYDKKGLVVVGLERQNGTKEQILKLLKPARVEYPVMAGGNGPVPSDGIPHAMVFGTDGKLVWHGHPASDEFEDAVKDALKTVAKTK